MPLLTAAAFVRADAVLREAAGVEFTGAVARIEHRGRLLFERAYGVTRAGNLAQPVYVDTRFDLASITKLFVATLALRAAGEGRLTLDDPLTPWLAQWSGKPHAAITLRMLLAHTSGMNSGADYRTLFDKNVTQFALGRELAAAPGEKVIYSDLGFIAIGELLQRVYGQSLAAIGCAAGFSAIFRPAAPLRRAIPATEEDTWRGRVQGVVHDEKAYLMGGISGHAGMFGTAADVANLTEQYLGAIHGRPVRMLSTGLAREAVREQAYDPVLRRGLGWAMKMSDDNSCGRYFSPDTFGHTGFVGTCVWADPERDCSGVLLTNTVYFGRKDTRELRIAFYDAMIADIEDLCSPSA